MLRPSASSCATVVAAAGAALASQPSTLVAGMLPVICGGVLSLIVIVCVQLVVLLARSVAVQVRVITLLQELPGLLWVSLNCTVRFPSQLSRAVTVTGAGTWLRHWKLAVDAGQPLN